MKKTYERVCPVCGAKFSTETKSKLYCSKPCCVKAWHEKNDHKNKKIFKCRMCGKEFKSNRSERTFCSRDCADQYRCLRNNAPASKSDVFTLTQLGKINVNRWIRLKLSDGTVATNKRPYTLEQCAKLQHVPVKEIQKALDEYDEAHRNGTEREFYKT